MVLAVIGAFDILNKRPLVFSPYYVTMGSLAYTCYTYTVQAARTSYMYIWYSHLGLGIQSQAHVSQ